MTMLSLQAFEPLLPTLANSPRLSTGTVQSTVFTKIRKNGNIECILEELLDDLMSLVSSLTEVRTGIHFEQMYWNSRRSYAWRTKQEIETEYFKCIGSRLQDQVSSVRNYRGWKGEDIPGNGWPETVPL